MATGIVRRLASASSVLPASAEPRTFSVTLATGQTVTVTVDVPPGTPVSADPDPRRQRDDRHASRRSRRRRSPRTRRPCRCRPGPSRAAPAPAAGHARGAVAPRRRTRAASSSSRRRRPARPSARLDPRSSVRTRTSRAPTSSAAPRRQGRKRRARTRTPGRRARRPDNPTFSLAEPGAAPIGVPNFFIDKFRIPPFLLSIYQAAGIEYGIRWEVLAAINEIETDYGRNLNVSSAGALGWMQFMPATWKQYGVDANGDRRKDPYNPVDAIFAAARYLKAAGAEEDLRKRDLRLQPRRLVRRLRPHARAPDRRPAGRPRRLAHRPDPGPLPRRTPRRATPTTSPSARPRAASPSGQNAALPGRGRRAAAAASTSTPSPARPVVAVQDGKVVKIGTQQAPRPLRRAARRLRQHLHVRAPQEGRQRRTRCPSPRTVTRDAGRARSSSCRRPTRSRPRPRAPARRSRRRPRRRRKETAGAAKEVAAPNVGKERLFANPTPPGAVQGRRRATSSSTGGAVPGLTTFKSYFSEVFGLEAQGRLRSSASSRARRSSPARSSAASAARRAKAPHMLFEIRPAGRGAPRIDPKPILDGWKLLESTAIYRAAGRNPFFGPDAKSPSDRPDPADEQGGPAAPRPRRTRASRSTTAAAATSAPARSTAACSPRSSSSPPPACKPTVTWLQCGHSYFTSGGNVSHHSSGNAVDIAKINGIPILGHQGTGSITDIAVRRLLTLQGTMKPAQIITLMAYAGRRQHAGDGRPRRPHPRRLPAARPARARRQFDSVLKPGQWIKLIDRLARSTTRRCR